ETFSIRVPRSASNAGKRNIRISSRDVNGVLMKSNEVALVCNPNPAVCGNGTTELFEQCDDGGTAECDGCSASCRVESCGNGAVECNEECDAGAANGTPGSGCTATCTTAPPALRIPGGGARPVDCGLECAAALA